MRKIAKITAVTPAGMNWLMDLFWKPIRLLVDWASSMATREMRRAIGAMMGIKCQISVWVERKKGRLTKRR